MHLVSSLLHIRDGDHRGTLSPKSLKVKYVYFSRSWKRPHYLQYSCVRDVKAFPTVYDNGLFMIKPATVTEETAINFITEERWKGPPEWFLRGTGETVVQTTRFCTCKRNAAKANGWNTMTEHEVLFQSQEEASYSNRMPKLMKLNQQSLLIQTKTANKNIGHTVTIVKKN